MRRVLFALVGATLAACQATPATTGSPERSAASSTKLASAAPFVSLTAPLAHEGGIVFLKPLEDIADQGAQTAAAALGQELAAQLRAERAMRDAGLLAASVTAAYGLLEKGPDGPSSPNSGPGSGSGGPPASSAPSPSASQPSGGGGPGPSGGGPAPTFPSSPPPPPPGDAMVAAGPAPRQDMAPPPGPTPWFADDHLAGPGGEPRAQVHEEERMEADDARTAWLGLSPDQRRRAEGLHDDRDRMIREHVAPQLARKAQTFQRALVDQTATPSVGGKTVTSTFHVAGAGGGLTLTVTRTFDAQGSLVQAVETMVGNLSGTGYNCERARTLKPDGTEAIAMDIALTIDGKLHTVRWAKQVAADGTPSGSGSILRPDGSSVALTSTATDAQNETIAGTDAAAGVSLKLLASALSSLATATLDAGKAGRAELQFDVDQLTLN